MESTFGLGKVDASEASSLSRGELVRGKLIANQYRIESMLGQGGMGQIYRAMDLELNRIVAVKRISPALLGESSAFSTIAKARFRGEAFLPAQISDENVITVLGFKEEQGEHFLILEFIPDAKTLKDLIEYHRETQTGMDEATLVTYLRQAASGLAAIHKHNEGVFHRDIKPQNLVVFSAASGAPRLKIIDFGVAHVPGADLTLTGMSIGTPSYLPPEFFLVEEGLPVVLDCRADLFGLGVSFYLAATLSRPWEGITDIRTAAVAYRGEATPARSRREDLSEGLEAVLMKLLAKDREARYQSAQEVLDDLNQLEALPAYVPPPSGEALEQSRMERLACADSDIGIFSDNLGAMSELDSMFQLTELPAAKEPGEQELQEAAFVEAIEGDAPAPRWKGLKRRDRWALGAVGGVMLLVLLQLGLGKEAPEPRARTMGLVSLPEVKQERVSGKDILQDAEVARKSAVTSLGEKARARQIIEASREKLQGSTEKEPPKQAPKAPAPKKATASPKAANNNTSTQTPAPKAVAAGAEKILPEHFRRWNEHPKSSPKAAPALLGLRPGDLVGARLDVQLSSTSPDTPVTALAQQSPDKGRSSLPAGSLFLGKPRFHFTGAESGHVGVKFETLVLPDGREFKVSAVAVRQSGAAGIVGRVESTGSRGKATGADAAVDVAGALLPGGIAGTLGKRIVGDQRAANRSLREAREVMVVPRGTRFQIRILKGV